LYFLHKIQIDLMLKRKELMQCLFKRLSGTIGMLFLAFSVTAQSYSRNDSVRIYQYLTMADKEALSGSLDTAMNEAKLALQLSKEKKMLRGEGFAKLKIADISVQKNHKAEVAEYLTDGMRIGIQLKDSFLMALTCYQQAESAMYNDKLVAAENLFNKALSLKFEKQQSVYTGMVYNDFGYLSGLKNEYEKQAEWYLKAMRVYEKIGDEKEYATSISSLGAVYMVGLENHTKAVEYTKMAIAIREKIQDIHGLYVSYYNLSRMYMPATLDSAAKYQKLAMVYAEKSGEKASIISTYDNMSFMMNFQNNKPEALAYIQKSIALCRELNLKAPLADKCRWAGTLCADMKDTIAMETYYNEAYNIAVELKNKTLLRDYYATRAVNFKNNSDFKNAYEYLKKYYAYRDSITGDKTATNIAELQTKYETEKKDNEITRLNTAQQIKQLEIEKQKAVIAGNRAATLQKQNEIDLLSKSQELRDIKIKQQEEDLDKQILLARTNEQQLQLTEKENQLRQKQLKNQKLVRNLLIGGLGLFLLLGFTYFNRYQLKKKLEQQNGLLAMRNNISRDLHDEIGATLSSVNMLSAVALTKTGKENDATPIIQQIKDSVQQAGENMDDIVWSVNPSNDLAADTFARIRKYVTELAEPKAVNCIIDIDEPGDTLKLPMELRRDIYLVCKEAVNNALKYSVCTEIKLGIHLTNTRLTISVADNGKGFDISILQNTKRNGITNMRHRMEKHKGSFEIRTEKEKGTFIHCEIPL
jgi:signal transduction histidine kinase